ncbi:unnamed protein product [Adineta steineri]|uniref:Nuclear receptor domain-containing protein n=1 Tax=Adineta steineri TaxID=433720 RepID=A0A814VMA0_9BILA|nr:unnamed protein product [Adineta steineri]CAF3673294.1 unnamed protein product [Adineta steineri]
MKILINDSDKLTNSLTIITRRSKEPLDKCKVCEAPAIHSNFGVICCSPCKMFFKRNAEQKQVGHFICSFGDKCEVNMNNRRICSSCRLTKCFASGMKIELIRGSRSKKNSKKRQKKNTITKFNLPTINDQLQKSSTFNLLQFDQSILTIEQWNILSYLFNCFDEQKQFLLINQFISEQNSLPYKFRFKCGSVRQLISLLTSKTQSLFEKNHDFYSLCTRDRSILLHRIMKYIAVINLSYIVQQTHIINYPSFNKILENLFGKTATLINKQAFTLINNFDVGFLKLAFTIICFSTIDYVIYENISGANFISVKRIMEIQDLYIELTWRYLVYEYSEQKAIVHFSSFIRFIFAVHNAIILMQNEEVFTSMIHSTIEQIEKTLPICI